MKYYIHPTRAVFGKNAVYYNAGTPYPLEDDVPPLRGSTECDASGAPIPEAAPKTEKPKPDNKGDTKGEKDK